MTTSERTETLAARRERGLNDLAAVIEGVYGHRCSRFEAGCMCCVAWAVLDMVERLTDGSLLDDAPEAGER